MDSRHLEKSSPELEDLAKQIGQFMEYWGFKKVHGQIWCHLFLSKEPLDAADLMQRLGISKALVSISLKELLQFEVIDDLGKGSRGTRCYSARQDIVTPILETLRRREQIMISRIMGAHSLLSRMEEKDLGEIGISHNKLARLGHLIKLADLSLETIIKKKWSSFADIFLLKSKLKQETHSDLPN